jgi:diguanylate cyclase (GGDEF)-like protein
VLLFMLWTTPYVGVFRLRARWVHGATTVTCLSVASVAVVRSGVAVHDVLVCLLITVATVLVVTLLVARVTDALSRQVLTDPLTGLHNRRAFSAHARRALARASDSTCVAVVVLDLDRFKNVNDTYGHHAGDALLVALAPRLLADRRPGDVVAWLGGDEFALLCSVSGEQEAVEVAARLSQAWSQPLVIEQGVLHVTGSVGVALSGPGSTPETLLRDADTAMYAAKGRGSGGPQMFRTRMHSASARLLAVESELRLALATEQLSVHYQPVVALGSSRPHAVGAEALVRWTSPVLGPVDPGEFIPVAEATGLIVALGTRVLEQALDDLARWRREGLVGDAFRVAVNVSAHQVTEGLSQLVQRLLAARDLPPRCLGIEVTESTVVRGPAVERVLAELSALGVVLLLDDFGTGQSSLAQLHRFPFDVVKVDRSFVSRMTVDRADRSIVQAVVSLATALDLQVVAEGVETADQQRALQDLRCDAGQGWLYSRAVPAAELPQVVAGLGEGPSQGCAGRIPLPRREGPPVRPAVSSAG